MKISKHPPGGWQFACKKGIGYLKDYKGVYRFQLSLTADNAKSIMTEINVHYAGDWNGFVRKLSRSLGG
jgi:hypothetical protein